MTSPYDISRTHKGTATLTFDGFIRDMLTKLGASSHAVNIWVPDLKKDSVFPTENSNSLPNVTHQLGEHLCRRQLLPGKDLDCLQAVFMKNIHKSLTWEHLDGEPVLISMPGEKTVSLLGWCREVLLNAATKSFFGERLQLIEPNLFRSFFIFDDNSWKLNYGYPYILSREMYSAKDKIIDALTIYFKLPKSERSGEASLIRNFEIEMRGLGIVDKDIAALVMPVYWV